MDILRAQKLAEDMDGMIAFDLCGPNGRKACTWLDPWMGLFQVDGVDGFMMASQLPANLWVENQRVVSK